MTFLKESALQQSVDWPLYSLVKPAPTFTQKGIFQANVEVYGGPILSTHF